MERIEVIVSGRVQGVSFRAFALQIALSLGLKGFVRNLANDSVEAVAEGKKEKIEKFLIELQKGPPLCNVENISVTRSKAINEFSDFEIRY
ncbi:MAG: acylphosphatase [Candidatus Diapherotrites archaeon]|uniref:acylphosphatase n=1 Tax=Candidatus Iainarchaeum sp. TaxID=3101447 RepID=A0A2D6LNU3_9ARCH|nr:acylphosphatase [Candidatus Diapherotrites archaeon]|tara:strand:+ start:20586 stop:20858 length:273 start_codon:yes stop_codon:yes gene_type:complete